MIVDLISTHSTFPWLIWGNMDDIFLLHSVEEGHPKTLITLYEFYNAFFDIGQCNLGFFGYEFTWCNYMGDRVVVKERPCGFCSNMDGTMALNFDMEKDFDILNRPFLPQYAPYVFLAQVGR